MPDPASDEKTPSAVNNKYWGKRSASLMTFLSTPRSWTEISAWADSHNITPMVVRNCLAWLAMRSHAVWRSTNDGYLWGSIYAFSRYAVDKNVQSDTILVDPNERPRKAGADRTKRSGDSAAQSPGT